MNGKTGDAEQSVVESAADAPAVRVLSASAQRAALLECAGVAARAGLCSVHFSWATSGAVAGRIRAGEGFDLVAASHDALAELAGEGLLAREIALTGAARIALGVRAGEAAPDISTPGKFCAALRAARRFACGDPAGGGTAGVYLERLMRDLGLLPELADKRVLRVGGYNVMAEVAARRADFGLTQSTEIAAVEGVEIGAWLAPELQMETQYAIAPGRNASPAAHAFWRLVTGPEGRDIYRRAGFALL